METGRKHPSLFPFLSVLVCMIGVMMFLAIAVAPTSLRNAEQHIAIRFHDIGSSETGVLFLECADGQASSKDDLRLSFLSSMESEVPARRQWKGTPFTDLLALRAANGGGHIVFLVRPSGIDVFQELRDVLMLRNRALAFATVKVDETTSGIALGDLPPSLRSRLSLEDGQVGLRGPLDAADRDLVRALFATDTGRRAVDQLYERAQKSQSWITYGCELIPAQWNVESIEVADARTARSEEGRS